MPYALEQEDLDLERYCHSSNCFGGKDYVTSKECDVCKGTGKVTTAFGDKVLEFVTRKLAVQ